MNRPHRRQGALKTGNSFKTTHLLPGVKPQGGDTHLLDVIFSWSKQQVPVRFGWKRDLQAGVTGSAGSEVRKLVPLLDQYHYLVCSVLVVIKCQLLYFLHYMTHLNALHLTAKTTVLQSREAYQGVIHTSTG